MKLLAHSVQIRRRYSRSVNLERDLKHAESVLGYVLTRKAQEILARVSMAAKDTRSVSAYTLTGVYGTGKSAFAHFFSALCSPRHEPLYQNAIGVLEQRSTKPAGADHDRPLQMKFFNDGAIPESGIIRAVATASREPVGATLLRALHLGVQNHYALKRGRAPAFISELQKLYNAWQKNQTLPQAATLLELIEKAAESAGGLLIIIDEMGKNLEYAASNPGSGDLYFLQQLAEHPGAPTAKIFFFGLLHQAFDEYAGNMTPAHRNEWAKVQGRFEDIPFYESPEETLAVMAHAIEHTGELATAAQKKELLAHAKSWHEALQSNVAFAGLLPETCRSVYPLHPVAARILPLLCQKYAQNDRSLFTFLAGHEPHSLGTFLAEHTLDTKGVWPSLKLHHLYDYFIESAGVGFRPGFGRWVEIQEKVQEARHYGTGYENAVKTIGLLNLLSSGGKLKAGKDLVVLSLVDDSIPTDRNDPAGHWLQILDDLEAKGLVVYRKGLDEYRTWHGSDFDIEKALDEQKQVDPAGLAVLLNDTFSMQPLVAQKQSYESGALRYYERRFFDSLSDLEEFSKETIRGDGLLLYYAGRLDFSEITPTPAKVTVEKKPILCVVPRALSTLRSAAIEYDALNRLIQKNRQLQLDKIARKEVNARLELTEKLLSESILRAYGGFGSEEIFIYHGETAYRAKSASGLNALLSDILAKTYSKGVILQNELIHRRELTSQGAKAQKLLAEAMFEKCGQERLGLTGFGPETSIFESIFGQSGIYAEQEKLYSFQYPDPKHPFYKAILQIEKYCLNSAGNTKKGGHTIDGLYHQMALPPFGVVEPLAALLLLLVFIKNSHMLSLYHNGSFVPIIDSATIELLLKQPQNFSVKSFNIGGIQGIYFKELETIFQNAGDKTQDIRKASLLHVVRPFIKFIQNLPPYTKQTQNIGQESRKVAKAILDAREPDRLLFCDIPAALGFIGKDEDISQKLNEKSIRQMKNQLVSCLSELQNAYDELLAKCGDYIFHYFGISNKKENLREDLRVRARRLEKGALEPLLKRFILAAIDTQKEEKSWLEALITVIADKPPESFKDEDIDFFEMKLASLSRRFQNLEALSSHITRKGEGYETRKITITQPDGHEIEEVIWVNDTQKEKLQKIARELFNKEEIAQDEKTQKALLMILAEEIFPTANIETAPTEPKIIKPTPKGARHA